MSKSTSSSPEISEEMEGIESQSQSENESSSSTIDIPVLRSQKRVDEIQEQTLGIQSLLLQAARYLSENDPYNARLLVEEALRINNQSVQAYEILADIFRNYQHNVPGSLQCDLVAAMLSKNLIKLVKLFNEIQVHFGDSKILKTCACKIIQFSENDQQRQKFFQFLLSKNTFKDMSKIYSNFVSCTESIDNLLLEVQKQQSSSVNLMMIYTRILCLEFSKSTTIQTKLIDEQCIQLIELVWKQDKKSHLQKLYQLIKAYIAITKPNIRLSLMLSICAATVGDAAKNNIDYCLNPVINYIQSAQKGDSIENEDLIIRYIKQMILIGENKVAVRILIPLIKVRETAEICFLYGNTLELLDKKVEAVSQYKNAILTSLTSENIEINIQARLQLSHFMSKESLPIEKIIQVLLPEYGLGKKVSIRSQFLTLSNYYMKFFQISTFSTTKEKQLVCLDQRIRAAAASYCFQSNEFQKYEQLFLDLAFVPLVNTILLILSQNHEGLTFFEQIDGVIVDAIKCSRFQSNWCGQSIGESIGQEDIKKILRGQKCSYFSHTNEVQQILQEAGIVRVALAMIEILPKCQDHCQMCISNKQLLLVQMLISLHEKNVIQLTDQLNKELTSKQLDLSIYTHHEELAYKTVFAKAKQSPENPTYIFHMVKLALSNRKLRQTCQKLLKRWVKKYDFLHLNTALVIIGLVPQAQIRQNLAELEKEYEQSQQDPCLELHMINIYMTLFQSRATKDHQTCLECAEQHFKRYLSGELTPEHCYNVATIMMNQFGMFQEAISIFRRLLGEQSKVFEQFYVPQAFSFGLSKDLQVRSAHNLSLAYQIIGCEEEAQRIMERWLTIEQ